MKNRVQRKENMKEVLLYVGLFAAILLVLWLVYNLNLERTFFDKTIIIGFWIAGGVCYLKFSKNPKRCLYLIIAIGIFLRVWYAAWTPYNIRTHDLGDLSTNEIGHASYILKMFLGEGLPQTNEGQFYQPPFFHFISAVILKFFSLFHGEDPVITMFQIVKVIPCFSSCMALLFMWKICEKLEVGECGKILVLGVMACFPNYLLMAGRVNNDSTAFLFTILIVYFSICWYQKKNMQNLIGLAISFGFGIMTKISVALLALPVAIMFFYELWKAFQERRLWKRLYTYVIFALISLPLGLWYPIRNFIKFGQPLNYVMDLSNTGAGDFLFVGDRNFAERFLPFFWNSFFEPIYLTIGKEYNVAKYIIKSSMFGEFSFEQMDSVACALLIMNIVMIVMSFAGIIYMAFRRKKGQWSRVVVLVWVMWIASYILFNIKYPFTCSMDFRYIAMTAFLGMLGIGVGVEELWKRNSKAARVAAMGAMAVTGLFCGLSAYCYLL